MYNSFKYLLSNLSTLFLIIPLGTQVKIDAEYQTQLKQHRELSEKLQFQRRYFVRLLGWQGYID
jgi:hypothetical protein